MRPLVSVVCACFNISKYLDEAIASIYAQGYPNLELIVVDDGSTDDTYERLAMLRHAGAVAESPRFPALPPG